MNLLYFLNELLILNVQVITLAGSIMVLLRFHNVLTEDIKLGQDKISAYVAILCGINNFLLLIHLIISKGKVMPVVIYLAVLLHIEFNFKVQHNDLYKVIKFIMYVLIVTLIFVKGVDIRFKLRLPIGIKIV